MNNIIINFREQCFTMERDGIVSRHHFAYDDNTRSIGIRDLNPADHSTKTDIEPVQKAANSITNRATEDYPRYELRNRAVSIVDMGPHSESKEIIKHVRLTSESAVIMIIVGLIIPSK